VRYLKYLALLVAVLALSTVHSQAQVSIGVQIGPTYGIYNAPPVCEYGFYPDYPFACAPYGYWGPNYFVNGAFIGVGPWNNFYFTHPTFYRPFYVNRGFGVHGGFERFHTVDRFGPGARFRGERFNDRRVEGQGFRNFSGPSINRDRGFDRGRGMNEARGFRGNNGYRGPEGRGGPRGGGGSYHGGGESHGGDHGGRR
jgi:uncharacterized membrane protein YgcG